ncbi:MAG: Si-specific NAD(P)(+) transhydrogenase [Planctomycetes bacterium]|nr:Si-specific NAD(P)(+) transhydrogenase [Planctomycetota bacterium]
MSGHDPWDLVVIGSGPAGQKAAVQASKGGMKVAVIERHAQVGGECVQRGTIPSKTLRETTMAFATFRQRCAGAFDATLPENMKVESLMGRLQQVVAGHHDYIGAQLKRNGIAHIHGRARFTGPHELEIVGVDGAKRRARTRYAVIAVGSRPRVPAEVPVDHEHILDSDSILSLLYLPKSLTILGAGVIASEYASIFAALGVRVAMVDKHPSPVNFLDPEITGRFVKSFERAGGRYVAGKHREVTWDGVETVVELESGETLRSEKLLCCLGREAALNRLDVAAAGLKVTERGFLAVDEHCRTNVPHIYAVGDVIGPPALAASSMEQGRRAVCHLLGLDPGASAETIPVGIYAIPEMAGVGLSEAQAHERFGGAMVGRARFEEIARGHIAGLQNGLLKMVADAEGKRLLGVQIVGEGATELIHLGQMGLLSGCAVDVFVENIFNFPTLAEAYRVAALDIAEQRGLMARPQPKTLPEAAGD